MLEFLSGELTIKLSDMEMRKEHMRVEKLQTKVREKRKLAEMLMRAGRNDRAYEIAREIDELLQTM